MNGSYWDVILWKKRGEGKNYPLRIGTARPTDDGGFRVFLDALPTPDERGTISITITPQRERGGGGGGRGFVPRRAPIPRQEDFGKSDDEEVPF